jgi:magnesium-transporting ATPase (P-type)
MIQLSSLKTPFFNHKIKSTPPLTLSWNHQRFSQETCDQCLENLDTNARSGLTLREAQDRQQVYGLNELKPSPRNSFIKLFMEQYSDRLSQILIGTVALSTISSYFESSLHSLTEPAVIFFILVLNGLAGAFQSRSAESSVAALSKLLPKYSCVLRDGEWSMVPASSLVPGDVILLRTGDHVPADARLLELRGSSFSTDESFLTGESLPVLKGVEERADEESDGVSSMTNMVFSGSTVTSGSALAVVTQTGQTTEIGKINSDVQQSKAEKTKTPLTQSLDRFTQQLTNLIGAVCLSIWLGNIPNFKTFGSWSRGALHYSKNAIALGVAAVPEGLPAAVTLCLSLGTRRMAKRNVIVRKLSSLETLGCTSVICTDKTGTLTTNQMSVTSLVTFKSTDGAKGEVAARERAVEGNSYSPVGQIEDIRGAQGDGGVLLDDISRICVLCNNAEVSYDPNNGYSRIGEPTEAALKVLGEKMGRQLNGEAADVMALTSFTEPTTFIHCQGINEKYRRVCELEFNRERKVMSVLCQDDSGGTILVSKGAPEMVLARCQSLKLESGEIVALDKRSRREVLRTIQELSQRPLRVIGTAYRDVVHFEDTLRELGVSGQQTFCLKESQYDSLESGLTFTGLCGITDPLRDNIQSSLRKCQDAGIRVMMMTGDSKETALSIGYQAGIFNSSSPVERYVISGRDFNKLSRQQQVAFLAKDTGAGIGAKEGKEGNRIFYRMESKDKKLLIQLLRECGEIVAMTGDGINDASALALADIGIAMGITGTEVTKESSDMILADDSFAGIVTAVEEGRSLYANLQSMISYLISCNLGEIGIIVLTSLLGLPDILLPLHLLYINLITDGPPATALSFNPSDESNMKKLPRNKMEPLITRGMMWRYLLSSSYEMVATVGAFVWWFLEKGLSWSQLMDWKRCSQLSESPSRCSPLLASSALSSPQSMALSVLLLIEVLKALSSISKGRSLLSVPPWKNKWLLMMIGLSLSFHLTIMYTPWLGSLLKIAPLSLREWKVNIAVFMPTPLILLFPQMAILFSFPILLINELLKFFQR